MPRGVYMATLSGCFSCRTFRDRQLLLHKGADINSSGSEYDNAVYAASARGHQETVQLLVENGAEVNGQGEKYDNAFQAASDRPSREC